MLAAIPGIPSIRAAIGQQTEKKLGFKTVTRSLTTDDIWSHFDEVHLELEF